MGFKINFLFTYSSFLTNIAKPSSVAGILQFTGPEAENYLKEFCLENLNLCDANNIKLSAKMESEFTGTIFKHKTLCSFGK